MALFSKFMNSYYYGKSGKGDLTQEDLPTTRMQLFWETLRTRLSGLMRLNLMYAVAWLPAIVVIGYWVLMMVNGMNGLANMQSEVAAGTLAAEELASAQASFGDFIRSCATMMFLWLVPAIAITGPATAGVALVTRNWARDEHAFIWSDFKDAVKANWKQALPTSIITGCVPLVAYVCWSFYGSMAATNGVFIIPQVLALMVGIVWMMSLMYTYPLMVTYKLRYRDVLRNALLLTLGRLPMTAGLKLLSTVPTLIAVLVSLFTPYMSWALMILALYYIVFGLALSRFVGASYSNAVFDRYINPSVEGAEINRGLYVERDDEDDDDSSEE